ncbi:MAG: Mur ligase [Alphaproteobacteria bacterium]|nr:Mur ligase [Alphaproteobacteria bacterium]|tara:strand:+ start:4935 stop:6581 length:1647 start_codon:yes stop_codon:yes gene_type:complete
MNMVETASITLIYLVFITLAAKRIMTYLHVLQQEDYDSKRLNKWIFEHKAFDKKLSLALAVLSVVWMYVPSFFMAFLAFICITITIYLEKDPRKSQKKKLVETDRAKRVFFPTLGVMAVLSAWCFVFEFPYNTVAWPWIIAIQLIPFVLIWVNAALAPFESVIQKVYWNEARQKMHDLSPIVIGVTGSFGKTSVKHILGHILNTQGPTLVTPGSVNTPMGITRIVREQLTPDHKYFVVEMGAYGVGSIASLCELTPPDFGIVTTIGHAHYERFKSLETVARAKFELAEAVMQKETGKVIIHERTLRFSYVRGMKLDQPDRFVVCGDPPAIDRHKQKDINYLEQGDVHIIEVTQQPKGLDIKFSVDGKTYNLNPPIYGLHHGHNVVMAAVTALELGVDIGAIQLALQTVPQISHRLEVKPNKEAGYVLIDDSYNSNPLGFRSALDLMVLMQSSGRKILITPGMIELGIAHDEAHAQIGEYAGQICDIAVVIKPERIGSFVNAYKASGKTLIEVQSFKEASEWLEKNRQDGDLVLIENDLPDMYECIPSM